MGILERTSKTVHSIQLLRAVAAMMVALHHGQQAFAERIASADFAHETYIFEFGAVGVHIFFVISGFIMVFTTGRADGYSARDFLSRRVIRIYPIYWVCALLYIAARAMIGAPYDLEPERIAGALLLLPGSASAIIGPGWTLSFEMFFYLSFGLAMLLGRTLGIVILAGVFAALIGLGLVTPPGGPLWDLMTDVLLLEFIAGAAIGWLLVHGHLPRRGGTFVVAASLILFAAGIVWGYDRLPRVITWGIPSALLVAGVLSIEQTRGAASWARRVGRFGDSSYVLYLIHILVIALALEVFELAPGWFFSQGISALIIALVALAVAEVLHARVERPLTSWLNSRDRPWNARKPASPAGV